MAGIEHESQCEFPWYKCMCTPLVQLEELSALASQKLDELHKIFKQMKELKDGKQPTQIPDQIPKASSL